MIFFKEFLIEEKKIFLQNISKTFKIFFKCGYLDEFKSFVFLISKVRVHTGGWYRGLGTDFGQKVSISGIRYPLGQSIVTCIGKKLRSGVGYLILQK